MSKVKMNCGYCGRKCDLDKDFCIPQDSVYVCKSCYDWQNRVADLEAKLAESEKQRQHLKDWLDDEILTSVDHESYNATINEYEEQIAELKQQLTEANKEIEYMNVSSDWQSLLILKQEMEILQTENKVLKRRNQDKISFAVEQLEKVKEHISSGLAFDIDVQMWFEEYIDNQIKQLKEGK